MAAATIFLLSADFRRQQQSILHKNEKKLSLPTHQPRKKKKKKFLIYFL
jgi:hypothetical protein